MSFLCGFLEESCLGEIKRLNTTDLSVQKDLARKRLPFVIERVAQHWPAMSNWRTAELKQEYGQRKVGVWALDSGGVTDYDLRRREEVRFDEFLTCIEGAVKSGERCPLYLVICPIFSVFRGPAVFPELLQDIVIPEVITEKKTAEINLWVGAGRNASNLHYDPGANLLVVLKGRKHIALFSPAQTRNLYPNPFGMGSNSLHSQVDVQSPDHKRFPKIHLAKNIQTTLEHGDGLYIPPGWWHFIVSEELNIAVNFWRKNSQLDWVRNPQRRIAIHYIRGKGVRGIASYLWKLASKRGSSPSTK